MKKIWSDSITRSCVITALLSKVGVTLVFAFYATFLLHNGLNQLGVSWVNCVFFITLFIFEIPTGALADVIGYKKSIVIASVISSIGMFVYAASHSFSGFALAEGFVAFGGTLYSGAFSAWLHNQLEREGRVNEQRKILSLSNMCDQCAWLMCGLLGILLTRWGEFLPFVVGGFCYLICAVYTGIAMNEIKSENQPLKNVFLKVRVGMKYARTHQAIRTLFLVSLVQTAGIVGVNTQWQPRFEPLLPSQIWIGGLSVLMPLGVLTGNYIARHREIHDSGKVIAVSELTIGLGVLVAGFSHSLPLILIAFVVHEVGRGFYNPVKQAFLNRCITDSETRATVISCEALSRDIGGMIGNPITGAIALHSSIPITWMICGVAIISVIVVIPGRLRC